MQMDQEKAKVLTEVFPTTMSIWRILVQGKVVCLVLNTFFNVLRVCYSCLGQCGSSRSG